MQKQQKMEYETLLHLQKNGNFPSHIDLNSLIHDNNTANVEQPPIQSTTVRNSQKRKGLEKPKNTSATKKPNFDMWCSTKNMKHIPHKTIQYGNYKVIAQNEIRQNRTGKRATSFALPSSFWLY